MIFGDGVDYGALWDRAKAAGQELYKELPGQVVNAVTKKATDTVTEKASNVVSPVVQQVAQQKASAVVSAGSVATFALVGAALGGFIAGGSWQRRIIGAVAVGTLGTVAGFKLGWARTST
jgi:hypothetical protein